MSQEPEEERVQGTMNCNVNSNKCHKIIKYDKDREMFEFNN